jgi:putative flippase GtrA
VSPSTRATANVVFVETKTPASVLRATQRKRPVAPQVDIVIPVYNEASDLERSVLRLYAYLKAQFPFTFRITVADNASTDQTWAIALRLEDVIPEVTAVHLDLKGRGRALNEVWLASDAEVLAYMDVDLSTDLNALLPLVAPLVSGHSDVAIGSRLDKASRVRRGAKREFISRCYNLILRTTLSATFSDAQCGFKAIRADRAQKLLPYVKDTGWFFDTELLVIAERAGMRIHEVPVDWIDDPDSRVDIVATAVEDIKGIARLSRAMANGSLPISTLRDDVAAEAAIAAPPGLVHQLIRFALVGVASTLAYLLLYLLLRNGMSAMWANATALLLTAIANTAVNRRLTFGVRGPGGRIRHQVQGLVVFALGLALTTGSLWVLHNLAPSAPRSLEVIVLVMANVTATLVRFLLFRAWIFPRRRTSTALATGTDALAIEGNLS